MKLTKTICRGARMMLFCFLLFLLPVFPVCAETEEDLIASIEDRSGKPIFKYWCDDFDYDGKLEMFAAVGMEVMDTTLWFASDKEVVEFPLGGYLYCDDWDLPEGICSIDSTQKLFVIEYGGGGSGSGSKCFYVKDGIAIPSPMAGEGLRQEAGSDFVIHPSAFDAVEFDGSGSGHTYKQYYLQWTGTEFEEYVGREISEADVESYAGGADILQQARTEGYSIGNILQRDNGIINVNLYKEDENQRANENLTLKIDGGTVKLVVVNHGASEWIRKYSYSGVYESAGLVW